MINTRKNTYANDKCDPFFMGILPVVEALPNTYHLVQLFQQCSPSIYHIKYLSNIDNNAAR